jgi:hypothetical protein
MARELPAHTPPPDRRPQTPPPDFTANEGEKYARAPHDQTQNFAGHLDVVRFDGTQFIAFLDNTTLKFNRAGYLTVGLQVPPAHVDEALVLRHLFTQPLPLSIDVQIARRARDRAEEDDHKLRLLDG